MLLGTLAMIAAQAVLPGCRSMARSASVGEIIAADDTVPGPCPARPGGRKLRYDPSAKASRAAVPLLPGDNLGLAYLPERPEVIPGEPLTIVARLGLVRVTKEVTALQAARAGGSLFVRDAAGKVFKASIPKRRRQQ